MSRDSPPRASTSKGKARAVDSDDEPERRSTSEHQSQRASSPVAGKKRKAPAAEAEGDGEGDRAEDDAAEEGGGAEDDHQKARRIRETRAGYRKLQTEVEGDRNNLIDTSVEKLSARVINANALFRKVRDPAEAVLDSRVLLTASDAGALKARQLKLDANAFDTDEFLIKLSHFMGGSSSGRRARRREVGESDDDSDREGHQGLRWELVGKVLAAESRRAPSIDLMYGPLESNAKQRGARKERQRARVDESERTKPIELESNDIGRNPKETTKMVADISTLLEQYGEDGIPYLKFVVNPSSFAQTVENMFFFSFLVREGKAAIEEDEAEDSSTFGEFIACTSLIPITTAFLRKLIGSVGAAVRCEPPTEEDKKASAASQLVFELTYEVWEGAIDGYGLKGKKSVIPTRNQPVVVAGTQKALWG